MRNSKNLLAKDNRLVFVGIIKDHFNFLYSTFRKGVKLYSNHKVIEKFMSVFFQLTMEELEKNKPILGPVSTVLVRFAERVFVLSRFNEHVIVIGLDVEVLTLSDMMANLIKTAASSAPDLPLPPETVQLSPATDI